MVRSIGQLIFTIESGLSDRELETLMYNASQANQAVDDFLRGDLSDEDFCDFLEMHSVNVDDYTDIVNSNLDYFGFG